MNLFFFQNVFLSPEIDCFFPKIGNNLMPALGRKKHMFFFGNARPKSNARAHLKQRKKHSGLRLVGLAAHLNAAQLTQHYASASCSFDE